MGILTRPLLHSAQRYDLEDYLAQLAALRADAHYYTQRFLSESAYVTQGFTIDSSFIGQATADVDLTSATLINGNNSSDISWWTAPAGSDPLTLPTGVGGLQVGINYVELEIYAVDGTPLQRTFWDPSANSGAGAEFIQEINTVTDMNVRVVINQSSFSGSANKLKLAIIEVDGSSAIAGIRDRRDLFYRLGNSANIEAGYTWDSQSEATTSLAFSVPSGSPFVSGEIVTFGSGATAEVVVGGTNNIEVFDFSNENYATGDSVVGGTSGATAELTTHYESFTGADKDISNQKDAFAALTTEIRRVKGTRFWYEQGGVLSLPNLLAYVQIVLAPIATGARFHWTGTQLKITDTATSGHATSDVIAALRSPGSAAQLLITRQDGLGGSAALTIPDGQILYVTLPTSGNRTFSESGSGNTNFKVANLEDFEPTDKNYILAYREDDKLIVVGLGELKPGEDVDVGSQVSKEILAYIGASDETSTDPQYTTVPSGDFSNTFSTADSLTQAISINAANLNDIALALLTTYREKMTVVSGAPANDNEVQSPVTSGEILTLPLDSRDSNTQKSYLVGRGSLLVFNNGQLLINGDDYNEVGSSDTLSTTIEILFDLEINDVLTFLTIQPQFLGTSALDQPFFRNYITGQNGLALPVGALYNLGTDRLQVYRNGLAMQKSPSVGDVTDRYAETNQNSLTLAEDAEPDEVFSMVNLATTPNVTLQTGVTGTVLTVPTYTIGNGTLLIYRNGVLLSTLAAAPTDLKYVETSTTSITLSLAAGVSDVFKVVRLGAVPQWRERNVGFTGLNLTIPNARSFTAADARFLVFRNGVLMNKSLTLGDAAHRYQENGTTGITLETAAVIGNLFEFLYI